LLRSRLGYWRRPEEEALVYRGAWFCGGDLAHIDADGYVWFHAGGNCHGGWKTSEVALMIRRPQMASLLNSGLRRPL
jgi:acyl-CoA synthetase (AMP-forming)/AMP-acid ligase II